MTIDADTHISPTGEDAMAITYDELLRRMDRAGVAKALTWLRPLLHRPSRHLPACRRGDRQDRQAAGLPRWH